MYFQTQPSDPVNVAYSSYQFRCDVYNAAKSKKAAPIRPKPIPTFSAPLLAFPVGVETAPEPDVVPLEAEPVAVELALAVFEADDEAEASEDVLEDEAELAEEAAEAEEEEAAEVAEAEEDDAEEAAEVAAAPVPVEVS